MTNPDVMTLLADANPVLADDLAQMDFPDLARRRSHGRLLLVAAAAVVAGVAASIAVFAFPSSHPSVGPEPGAIRADNSWQTIALSDASTALGAPVVLPNTDFVQPSDAAPQARTPGCSADSCAIFVSFPAQSLGINYTRPAPFPDPRAQWAADVQTAPAHHAEAQLVDLNGIPGDYIDYPGVKRLIEFVIGDTWVVVGGPGDYDKATLQAAAQSIVDQEGVGSGQIIGPAGAMATMDHPLGGFGRPVSLAAAASELGGQVTLPNSAQVTPSDVGAVWAATASGEGERSVSVGVTFPAQGLIIQYLRPPIPDPLSNYQGFVKDSPGSRVIYLNGGVPARAIPQTSDPSSWGSIEFVAGGTTILVMGQVDQATLQPVAQSIVDRSAS